jgi:hypothetical protein
MSYIVKVFNQSPYTWFDPSGTVVKPGDGWNAEGRTLGNAVLSCNELGPLNFMDIGDTHIPGDSRETWGVLISYQNEEIVGRYEGGGQLSVQILPYGQLEFGGNMDMRQVSLSGFAPNPPKGRT